MAHIELGVRVPFPNYMTSPEYARRVVKCCFGFDGIAEMLNGGTLVDFGCGIGTVLAEIEKQHPSAVTVGIDKENEYLEEACKRVSGRLIRATLNDTPLRDSSVDVAFSRRIYIPFNEKCEGITTEIHRVLKAGGIYVCDEAPGYHEHREALVRMGMEVVRDSPLTMRKP